MNPANGAGRRLVIDWTRCDGHGLCAALSGGAITLDEWGYPMLPIHSLNPAGGHAGAIIQRDARTLRRIVSLCPSLALRLETDDATRRYR
ncbi:4Fe-4S single cluster protein [Jatrophihabitans sp. GAS493]|uniref:ferredoxin n=1 Tax=Jatrophihabitans sp. GAS493 TaxID=1907575 RepID=UPI000BB6C8EF|nr:ferredoxin [Jatrophihabitans sp. GAS493]SOD70625.1 4Fe-4S single cluster protein [Jatrophihabitans sp. GAS493]